MLLRTRVALVAAALTVPGTVHAYLPAADAELVATDAAELRAPLREHVTLTGDRPLRAQPWQRFVSGGGTWAATWDAATKVPSRIWGTGVPAPGSVASAEVAAAWARATLAAHLDLIAPGSTLDDFALVSNVLLEDQRVVGFVQRHQGLAVLGGQVSFRFKNDRLFVIGSEALPDVRASVPRARQGSAALAATARDATIRDLGLTSATATASDRLVVLPLIGDGAVLGYRTVLPVEIDGGGAGRWTVYVEPAGGAPLARASRIRYGTGKLVYDAVDRYPGPPRVARPAGRVHVTVDGAEQTTAADGTITWSGDGAVTITASAVGDLVKVVNKGGRAATEEISLSPGGVAVWGADEILIDAQVQAYVATMQVNDYVRANLAPLPLLDTQLPVNVNLGDGQCNAFFDGSSLNFYKASSRCQNTALLPDVVFHEFGHALHQAALIPGVGRMDGALGEGMADFLAAMITADPGMGRGFFFDDEALRHLDPPDKENIWPRDVGEIHQTGIIFGGAMWDLRAALIGSLGEAEGLALTNKLYLAAIRTSTNIPTTLVEILAADDDNGNLADGTPHECAIRGAFGRHGLRTVVGTVVAPGTISGAEVNDTPIELRLGGLSAGCADDQIDRIDLVWRPRGAGVTEERSTSMAPDVQGWRAGLPNPLDGEVLEYQIVVTFVGGATMTFPDNRAAPWYELYRGTVQQLYCTDFETDPFAAGWTHGGEPMEADVWQWGAPGGGASGDPAVAFDGERVIGTNLRDGDGSYGVDGQARSMWLSLPRVEVGTWSDVHLQYWRWLTVEDAFFDQAEVTVDGEVAWQNLDSDLGDSSTAHHQDQQWVFHDVPLSQHLRDRDALISFELNTDRGLAFGGWNIDNLCVVANVNSICGDGVLTGPEQCDDGAGNADVPDACRTNCRIPLCGDAILDAEEECDDGNDSDTDTCTPRCERPSGVSDACECSGGGHPASLAPMALLIAALLRRRRPRA